MTPYRIHPIVLGTKIFDQSMMTYQHGQGTSCDMMLRVRGAADILIPLHEPRYASLDTIP